MQTEEFISGLGNVGVTTTNHRGHTIEEVADMATAKIVSVSDDAPAPIRAQAHAFKNACKTVIMYYMLEAKHNFLASGGNSFKLALYTSSATMSAATTAFTTTNQASGTNYTSGGNALTNVNPTSSGTTGFTDFADLTFGTATITARGCMIYNDTNADRAVAVFDFGGDKTSTAGSFTISFPTADASNAVIRIA